MAISKYQKELNDARNNCDFYHHGVCVVIDTKKRMPCFCLKLKRDNMNIPRRIQLDKMVPAEKALYEVGLMIEELGADEKLTEAVVLLTKVKMLVSDYVDSVTTK